MNNAKDRYREKDALKDIEDALSDAASADTETDAPDDEAPRPEHDQQENASTPHSS